MFEHHRREVPFPIHPVRGVPSPHDVTAVVNLDLLAQAVSAGVSAVSS